MSDARTPAVTVVITTYNRRVVLREAVESVVAQSISGWELLVVDDASTDGTELYLAELDDPRIRCFRQPENRERSAARNWGLAEAHGELILFLDDDDRLRPNALELLCGATRANPQAVAAAGGRWKFRVDVYGVAIPHAPFASCRVIWPEIVAGWSAVPGQSLYRTEAVRRTGGFRSESIPVEDRQMWLKVAKQGPVALVPTITMEYRDYAENRRPADLDERRARIYREFLDELEPRDRERGERARIAGALAARAVTEYENQRPLAALGAYLRALWIAPSLLVSPLTGPLWLRGIAKAVMAPLWRPRVLG